LAQELYLAMKQRFSRFNTFNARKARESLEIATTQDPKNIRVGC